MPNPLEDLSIFHISTPKDKKTGARAAHGWITIKYSKSNMSALAFYHYQNKPIARATGYGYDKTHTALAQAVQNLANVVLPCSGDEGYSAVERCAKAKGIKLKELRNLGPKY